MIKSAFFDPEKLLSNYETSATKIQNKFSHIDFIEFLNFNEEKPGDYRNEVY